MVHSPLSTEEIEVKDSSEDHNTFSASSLSCKENQRNIIQRAVSSASTPSSRRRTTPKCNMDLLVSIDDFSSVLASNEIKKDHDTYLEKTSSSPSLLPPSVSPTTTTTTTTTSATNWMNDLHQLQRQLFYMTKMKEREEEQMKAEMEARAAVYQMWECNDNGRNITRSKNSGNQQKSKRNRRKQNRNGSVDRTQTISTSLYDDERINYRRPKNEWSSDSSYSEYSDNGSNHEGTSDDDDANSEYQNENEILKVLQNIRSMRAAVEGTLTSP